MSCQNDKSWGAETLPNFFELAVEERDGQNFSLIVFNAILTKPFRHFDENH